MAAVPIHTVIKNPDGSVTEVIWTAAPVVTPPVDVPPVKFPEGANTVTIGTTSYPLAAIDPPTTDPTQPGGRGADKLIIITKVATLPRNQWGWEASVDANSKVLATGKNVSVPPGGYVLSANGKPEAFVKGLKTGDVVTVTKAAVAPPVVTPPRTTGGVAVEYLMDGVGHVSQLSAYCTCVCVAFYQGTGLVEWGGDTAVQTGKDLTAWRKPGKEILVSLGGQGGTVVLDKVDEGAKYINDTYFTVDGIDLDNEAFSLNTQQTIDLCDATSKALGKAPKDFLVQFPPPGGPPVATALATAVAVKAKGYRVRFGQQLYETLITDQAVMDQTEIAVKALSEQEVLVGIMLDDSHGSWTLESAVRRMKLVLVKWPNIGGFYVWESSRPGTKEVVDELGILLGILAATGAAG